MKKLLLLFFSLYLFSCNNTKVKNQNWVGEGNKVERVRDSLSNLKIHPEKTLLNFSYGMTVENYVNHLNTLIVQDEFYGGPDIFYWNVNVTESQKLKCKVTPYFYKKELVKMSCVCDGNIGRPGITYLNSFKSLISKKYGDPDFSINLPDTEYFTHYWFREGQEIELKNTATLISINYISLYHKLIIDDIKKSKDSISLEKAHTRF